MITTTETKPETTPLPWRVLDGAILSDTLNAYGNFVIADCNRERVPQDEANLRLIVKAVNNHAQLITALTDALESLKRLPDVDGAYRQTCIKQAENTLSRVRG